MAAAEAIASAPQVRDSWVAGLVRLLETPDAAASVHDRAALALARYSATPKALQSLINTATGRGPLPQRAAATAALGKVPAKRAAATLIVLLDGDAPEAVEARAASALEEMTGLPMPLGDLDAWQAWWRENEQLEPAAFEARLLQTRNRSRFSAERRLEEAENALVVIARQQYRKLQPADQQALLIEYLDQAQPTLRRVAVALILDDAEFGQAIIPAVLKRVRRSISDPDALVRRNAARVVQRANDPAAGELLAQQIPLETADRAKVAQLEAVGELRAMVAMNEALAALEDRSPEVARVAAQTVVDLSESVSDEAVGGSLVPKVSDALRSAFEATATDSRTSRRLRREFLTHLARVNDPRLVGFYVDLLARLPQVPGDIREQALRGLQTIGDDRVGDTVARFLRDREPRVREAAVRSLGTTSLRFERADELRLMLDERNEPSEPVLTEMFPRASIPQLANWPDRFRSEPNRELVILQVLLEKTLAAGDEEEAAFYQQRIGDVYLADNRPLEAIPFYEAALDFSLQGRSMASTLKERRDILLKALIRAQRYERVAAFASTTLERDRSYLEYLGAIIKAEAIRFVEADQLEAARQLIAFALALDPPMDRRTAQQLEEYAATLGPPATSQEQP
jgi:HEAT repeat protein